MSANVYGWLFTREGNHDDDGGDEGGHDNDGDDDGGGGGDDDDVSWSALDSFHLAHFGDLGLV